MGAWIISGPGPSGTNSRPHLPVVGKNSDATAIRYCGRMRRFGQLGLLRMPSRMGCVGFVGRILGRMIHRLILDFPG